jgi:hypothetical protein
VEMDKGLIAAFQKREREIERNKKLEEQRKVAEVERQRTLRVQIELEKKKKRQSVLIYFFLSSFLVLLVYGVHLSRIAARAQGKTMASWAGNAIKEVVDDIVQEEVDCSKPDNWKLEFCVWKRKQAIEQEWSSISFNKDGKDAAFSVNKP